MARPLQAVDPEAELDPGETTGETTRPRKVMGLQKVTAGIGMKDAEGNDVPLPAGHKFYVKGVWRTPQAIIEAITEGRAAPGEFVRINVPKANDPSTEGGKIG